jgi:hypothetical protein
VAIGPTRGHGKTERQADRAAKRTRDRNAGREAKILRRTLAEEATRLGVDPALWARVNKYWEETTPRNRACPLEGYAPHTLTRRDFSFLKAGGKLTGDVANEVGCRITAHAPHVAFLNSTFLAKVAPNTGKGSKCGPRFWTGLVGKGADAKIGTAKEVIIAPHSVPDHWCCVTADLRHRTLHYYDPLLGGADRAEALRETCKYIDQVYVEQAEAPIGAASFESTVIETPQQPDGVSCGVCVLIEMQRTVDGETYSRRGSEFTEL